MKKFTKNNQRFICINCNKEVSLHPTSSRDHCNYCLYSLHVDIYPGDRLNECKGILKPIDVEVNADKTKLIYECQKCHLRVKNISAIDDNFDEIIKISVSHGRSK